MQKQEKTDFNQHLAEFRKEIDTIDIQLLRLFEQRCSIVAEVGRLKARHGLKGSYIKPGREAVMIRDLLSKSDGSFPKASIAAIWRIIIGSSTALESPLNTVSFDSDPEGSHAAAHYFGPEVPHQSASEDEFFSLLSMNPHSIAVVPYILDASWWQRMPDPMRVFACLPFVGMRPTHLALGQVETEPTGADMSLFYDYDKKVVFEQKGFHSSEKPLVSPKKNALFIGAYALPCAL